MAPVKIRRPVRAGGVGFVVLLRQFDGLGGPLLANQQAGQRKMNIRLLAVGEQTAVVRFFGFDVESEFFEQRSGSVANRIFVRWRWKVEDQIAGLIGDFFASSALPFFSASSGFEVQEPGFFASYPRFAARSFSTGREWFSGLRQFVDAAIDADQSGEMPPGRPARGATALSK